MTPQKVSNHQKKAHFSHKQRKKKIVNTFIDCSAEIDMCSKLAPPPLKPRTTPRIRTKAAATTLIKPSSRKTRSKTRKPKYLSLRLELSQHSSSQMTSTTTTTPSDHQQQLNLFPLHPENLVDQDRLMLDTHDQDHSMAASFFSAADDGAATTLTGLLSSAVTLTNSSVDEDNLSPSSLNYGEYSTEEGEHNELVRTAMRRNKERDGSTEEKWVCYSEVVEEVSSSSACGKQRRWNGNNKNQTAAVVVEQQRRLSLKLDYKEIMNAWSDKGPLYINHTNNNNSAMDSPQTVPDLLHDDDDDFFSCSPAVNNGLWRVPEMREADGDGKAPPWEWKTGGVGQSQREASVQRYKEKRQNRLFAKKIRYQVRKLNAEKRPRIKGRFVKRI